MRYNPPPTWPAAPEGWQPPPGWEPDPSWPPAPEGWQLWVDDEGTQDEQPAAAADRGPVVKMFLIGVGVFLAGAISTIVASGSGGGVIWYGGMIFGALLLFRSFMAYRASRSAGAAALGTQGKAVAAVGLVACLGVGGFAVSSWAEAESLTPTTGSCWKLDGEEVALVPCSRAHDFKAVAVVKEEAQCPASMVGWVEGDGSDLVCLAND